jgi:membrane protein YdbS with pleckstrin-like domain
MKWFWKNRQTYLSEYDDEPKKKDAIDNLLTWSFIIRFAIIMTLYTIMIVNDISVVIAFVICMIMNVVIVFCELLYNAWKNDKKNNK